MMKLIFVNGTVMLKRLKMKLNFHGSTKTIN
jgi:hypothetical protein